VKIVTKDYLFDRAFSCHVSSPANQFLGLKKWIFFEGSFPLEIAHIGEKKIDIFS
jgi:hypothetical protein